MEAVFCWLSNRLFIKCHFRATDEWGAVCGRRPNLILVSLPLGFQMQNYSIQWVCSVQSNSRGAAAGCQLSSSHMAAGNRDMGPSSYFTKGLSFLRWKALWVNLFAVRENLCCPLNLAVVTKWVCSNSRSLAGKKKRRERKPQRTSGLCHSCAQPDGREVICVHKIWGESNEERRCVSVRNSVAWRVGGFGGVEWIFHRKNWPWLVCKGVLEGSTFDLNPAEGKNREISIVCRLWSRPRPQDLEIAF